MNDSIRKLYLYSVLYRCNIELKVINKLIKWLGQRNDKIGAAGLDVVFKLKRLENEKS